MQQGAMLSLFSSGLSSCCFCVYMPFQLSSRSWGSWVWVVLFLKGEELSTKIQVFIYLFPVGRKNSGGPAGSDPTRSKATRFVVKIERIFGQVARSL